MAKREMLVVFAAVDDDLESRGVEGIDKHPDAYNGGQESEDAGQLVAQLFIVDIESVEHHHDGGNAEEEK